MAASVEQWAHRVRLDSAGSSKLACRQSLVVQFSVSVEHDAARCRHQPIRPASCSDGLEFRLQIASFRGDSSGGARVQTMQASGNPGASAAMQPAGRSQFLSSMGDELTGPRGFSPATHTCLQENARHWFGCKHPACAVPSRPAMSVAHSRFRETLHKLASAVTCCVFGRRS